MIAVLGSFDGFHKGHQSLFSEADKLAEADHSRWGVVTFSPHPQLFFSPNKVKLLFTELEKDILAQYLEIPQIIRIPFTEEVANLSPESFLEHIHKQFNITGIVVGNNFRFGKGRVGTIDFLRNYCRKTGLAFSCVPTMSIGNTTVSSTMIRGFISCGEVNRAKELLGYFFFMTGKVAAGNRRGRKLGYPTANLCGEPHKVIPAEGVYAGAVLAEGEWKAAAVNVGYNPTFGDIEKIRVEAHMLDFHEDIYSKKIHVVFFEKIRGELTFKSASELERQIAEDSGKAGRIYIKRTEEMPAFFRLFRKSATFYEKCEKPLLGGLNNM